MIEMNYLIAAQRDSEILRHKRLLEEIFHLCLNESFRESVLDARESFSALNGGEVTLPTTREIALEVRDNLYHNHRDQYRTILNEVADRHNYYHPSFTRDYKSIVSDVDYTQHFCILENIIFLNAPLFEEDTREHFNTRSGSMEIADDEPTGPYIKITFDIGTSKEEMIEIIRKTFQTMLMRRWSSFLYQKWKDLNPIEGWR